MSASASKRPREIMSLLCSLNIWNWSTGNNTPMSVYVRDCQPPICSQSSHVEVDVLQSRWHFGVFCADRDIWRQLAICRSADGFLRSRTNAGCANKTVKFFLWQSVPHLSVPGVGFPVGGKFTFAFQTNNAGRGELGDWLGVVVVSVAPCGPRGREFDAALRSSCPVRRDGLSS